jgi:hypothetical protein
MALPVNHPFNQAQVNATTTSIGGTPLACYTSVPFRGRIVKVGCVAQGVITTADCAVAVAINGTASSPCAFTVPVASAAAGQIATATPTTNVYVNEDDVLTFTPSGASGASIGGRFFAIIQPA